MCIWQKETYKITWDFYVNLLFDLFSIFAILEEKAEMEFCTLVNDVTPKS